MQALLIQIGFGAALFLVQPHEILVLLGGQPAVSVASVPGSTIMVGTVAVVTV